MNSSTREIGGYPPLELPRGLAFPYPGAMRYQSARASFTALLAHMPSVRTIWMPAFICDSMLSAVEAAGRNYRFYHLEEGFRVPRGVELADSDLLLFVDYFGTCSQPVSQVLGHFPADQVVIDCSQAFYQEPRPCLATLYSPRKFFGVPDGGLLCTALEIPPATERDSGSIKRTDHLLQRLAHSAAAGYASFQQAEASLADPAPKAMSLLTERLLESIDYEDARARRNANFRFLHERLGDRNQLAVNCSSDAPLCYPFLAPRAIDKRRLAQLGMFVPTYWPEVAGRPGISTFEQDLLERLVALPVSQALTAPGDVEFIVESVGGML